MLFGNAHIKAPLGKPRGEQIEPRAVRHGGSHRHDAGIVFSATQQGLRENLGIGGRVWRRLDLHAGQHIELARGMTAIPRRLGRGIALAFLGQHMDQHRPGRAGMGGAQHRQ